MSAMVSDAPAVQQPPKDKKKSKRERTKKRDREPGADDATEHKSKKAKQQQKATDVEADEATANGSTAGPTEKSEKKKKQRHRSKSDATEVAAVAEEPVIATEEEAEASIPAKKEKKEKKSKKSKKETTDSQLEPEAEVETQPAAVATSEEPKKRRKRDRKSKDYDAIMSAVAEDESAAVAPAVVTNDDDADAMEIDSTPVKKTSKKTSKSKTTATTTTAAAVNSSPPTSTKDRTYPFFTQTVSLYLPLFPQGMTEPLEGYADQHLKPLLNRYVPDLKGILLAYRNPRLGERPGARSLEEQSTQEDVALLESIAEYAVAYGWFTAEVDIFRPSRGAWMEGTINLQSEGFVGVICFDMFNASIEKGRLPEGWKWVDTMSSAPAVKKSASAGAGVGPAKQGKHITFGDSDEEENAEEQEGEAEEEEGEEDAAAEEEAPIADSTEQLHQTGYWVDATGARVTGKLPFRIKNYEVGSSETHGYLSIEGTMLSEEDELAKVLDEREEARRRRKRLANSGYLSATTSRRIPDFATTKFAVAPIEEEEDEMQRAEKWKKGGDAVEDDI